MVKMAYRVKTETKATKYKKSNLILPKVYPIKWRSTGEEQFSLDSNGSYFYLIYFGIYFIIPCLNNDNNQPINSRWLFICFFTLSFIFCFLVHSSADDGALFSR